MPFCFQGFWLPPVTYLRIFVDALPWRWLARNAVTALCITGTTKGRGFQGVVKRWGFGGGPNTHGNTKHRRPGSIGPGTDPSRVIKGKKMPGHYGAERHTQIGLRVEKVDAERNLVYVRGAVPGPTNGIVVVRKQG